MWRCHVSVGSISSRSQHGVALIVLLVGMCSYSHGWFFTPSSEYSTLFLISLMSK